MTITALIKDEKRIFLKSIKCKDSILDIIKEIEKLSLLWEFEKKEIFNEGKKPALLNIAGSVEIGPMTSRDIDKEVYKL